MSKKASKTIYDPADFIDTISNDLHDLEDKVGEDLKIIFAPPKPKQPPRDKFTVPTPSVPTETPHNTEFQWLLVEPEYIVKERAQISDKSPPNVDIRTRLINMYWEKLLPTPTIMYQLGYGSEKSVMDDLRRYDIPLRAPEVSKIQMEVLKQYESDQNIKGEPLDSDGTTLYSDAIDTAAFSQFYLFISLNKVGNPSYSYLRIIVEFSNDKDQWFMSQDPPFNQMYETEDTIPTTWVKAGLVYGKYMRIGFTPFTGITLDANNYFFVDALYVISA